ncbi:MAG: hypothetical protein KJ950_01490 [Proteobacteria bacterium]|nr:hypothetical protein [Pseudomonadota bacterium]MBU1687327.1 hypothetical protein [Pseudomonadota bacterium]
MNKIASRFPWWKKVVFSFLPLVLLLALTEGGLWLAGYESPVADPYESFVFRAPLFVDNGETVVTDFPRRHFFHEQEFLKQKPAGAKRVFVFGGSTTYGYGLANPRQESYVSQLGILLEQKFPGTRFEMINCGGLSYASYRLVDLVEESMQYEPDLVILMSGHNEFIEARHYKDLIDGDSITNRMWYSIRIVRLLYDLATRVQEKKPMLTGNPFETEKYIVRDELEFQYTLDHYTRNLNRMADACQKHKVPMIISTCPSNLLDQVPFRTDPPAGMSEKEFEQLINKASTLFDAGKYEEVLALANGVLKDNPKSAGSHYIAGLCDYQTGRMDEARRHLMAAKDMDAFPKRALTSFNERVREISRQRGLPLFDAEKVFRDASKYGLPGKNLFIDDCHPVLAGHRLFAEGLLPLAARLL